MVCGGRSADLVALDDAMNALAVIDPRKVQVVEMRFFGGLKVEEIAEVLRRRPGHRDEGLEHRQSVAVS